MTHNFDLIEWADDERAFTLDGVSYVVEQHLDGVEPPGSFRFYKPRPMIAQYESMFASLPQGWRPRTIVELGIWHGGSAAFWTQIWKPDVLIGIDYDDRQDASLLEVFRENEGATTSIHTYWNTDQIDIDRLLSIIDTDAVTAPGLIIDDASHKYRQTRASFEGLFPRLRPGGIYVIEDWSWSHDEAFLAANPKWRDNAPLAPIIADLSEALFVQSAVIERVVVFPDFIAIERGSGVASTPLLPAHRERLVPEIATRVAGQLSRRLGRLRHRR